MSVPVCEWSDDGPSVSVPVCEWGDDESLRAAEELILVLEVDVRDGDDALVGVLDEVEARLFLPLKVRRRLYVLRHLVTAARTQQQSGTSSRIS